MNAKSTIIAVALCGLSLWLVNSPAAHAAAQTSSVQTDSAIVAEAVGGTPYDLYIEAVDPSAEDSLANEFDGALFAVGADQSLSVLTSDRELRIAEARWNGYVGEYLGTVDSGPFAGKHFEM